MSLCAWRIGVIIVKRKYRGVLFFNISNLEAWPDRAHLYLHFSYFPLFIKKPMATKFIFNGAPPPPPPPRRRKYGKGLIMKRRGKLYVSLKILMWREQDIHSRFVGGLFSHQSLKNVQIQKQVGEVINLTSHMHRDACTFGKEMDQLKATVRSKFKHLSYSILCLSAKFNSRQNICFPPSAKLNSRQLRQILFSTKFSSRQN